MKKGKNEDDSESKVMDYCREKERERANDKGKRLNALKSE